MNLTLLRYSSGVNDTLGLLFIDGEFECYTLEDEYREVKVKHKTRIPEGKYRIGYMESITPLTKKYRDKYSWFDKHIHLKDVPGFTSIYIHIGNYDDDTSGCILVGQMTKSNVYQDGYVAESTKAYYILYSKLESVLNLGTEEIWITIKDINI